MQNENERTAPAVWPDTKSLARKVVSSQRRCCQPTTHDSCVKDGVTFRPRKVRTDEDAWRSGRAGNTLALRSAAQPELL